jgi:methyltransferase-like protein
MATTQYDLVPYPALASPYTHAERLATVGKLLGMQPAPVENCRVLEIGCSDAGNLIPMAYALPSSRFVGLDLAPGPIADGRRAAADLGLDNLTLRACDLRDISADWGEFDYIVAHGLYSWVPEDVREGLLAVCGERLASEGIAYISYNAHPGGRIRQMVREMVLYHIRHAQTARERIGQARQFLENLLQVRVVSSAWLGVRDEEIRLMLALDDSGLYHDDLAESHECFYFHEFAAAAGRHGLQYLGEGEPHQMFDPKGTLTGFQGDVLEYEQYLDLMYLRRFRRTLLCRVDRPLERQISPQQMPGFLFSAQARRLENGQIEGARKVCIAATNEAAANVAMALGEVYPGPVPFQKLVPCAGNAEVLSQILYEMMLLGFVNLHLFDFPCQKTVTERPRANRLVRYQAARSNVVTSAYHMSTNLDEVSRRVVELLDGTRTHDEIAASLQVEQARESLGPCLERMALHGLLEG